MIRPSPRLLSATLALLIVSAPLSPAPAADAGYHWEVALPGYHYEFPRDHFNHPGYQTEWWYYTGNLRTPQGHRYGFELTFFRQGIARPVMPTPGANPGRAHPDESSAYTPGRWRVDDIWLAHLALSDLDSARFLHYERMNRAGPGLAGADISSRRIWNGNWQVQFDAPASGAHPVQHLQAVSDDFTLQLTLVSQKPPVIHGVEGVSQKAPGRGQASHYISFTRLDASGTLALAGQSFSLAGTAWMDHEFFSHQLTPDQVGWDWMSIQLADNEELMLYRLRRADGAPDPFSAGTIVDARGAAHHLAARDFSIVPGAAWTSPASRAQYPVHWTVRVPALALELSLSTPLDSQELVSTNRYWPTYWEGAITAHGVRQGAIVTGVGYLEMTGYDRAVAFPK